MRPDIIVWPTGPTRWIDKRVLYVSIPFTWNLETLYAEFLQGDIEYDRIVVGGPAIRLIPHYFGDIPNVTVGKYYDGVLQRINPYATRTSVGCVRRCSFCAVPTTEGTLVELEQWPDLPIICDNNLLATSQAHFDRVCDRLEAHSWSDFNQGLDARLLTSYHAERLARLKGCVVRLALDASPTKDAWVKAYDIMIGAGFPKSRMRSYILCGYHSAPDDAWARCKFVESHGVLALPQWYHALDELSYGAIRKDSLDNGWNEQERDRIMQYYYQHRGVAK